MIKLPTQSKTLPQMDWYSWLSKSGLNPSLTYEYGLLFDRNELEPGDAVHFDHDLLKSMGISTAKHRLEILKLARMEAKKKRRPPNGTPGHISGIAMALHTTKKCLAKCMHGLARAGRSSSVTVVPRICSGDADVRVLGAAQRRSVRKEVVLMITDGRRRSASQSGSPMVHSCYELSGGDGEGWSASDGAAEEIKWDSMFQDLKPT